MTESASQHLRHVQELFEESLTYPSGEARERYLQEACANNPETLTELQRLLRHYTVIERTVARAQPLFGAYQASHIIGRGGMGVVYEAYRADGQYQRRVAVKVIASSLITNFLHEELRRERQILASLDHPNIARLIDGGIDETGAPYQVMEFIDGLHLDRFCDEHNLDAPGRLALFHQVLNAVEYAHSLNIVHRDLKPSNILVDTNGNTKLLDFGAARLLRSTDASVSARCFTPEFASPELMAGEPVDKRADIYSLGVIYSKLVGKQARARVVRKATFQIPERRYASITDFRNALRHNPWPIRVVIGALLCVIVASGVYFYRRPKYVAISPPGQSWRQMSLSNDGKWLAFVAKSKSSGQLNIWVSQSDGSLPQQLFEDTARDHDPAISPDGRFVAFVSETKPAGIYQFDRQSRQKNLLVTGGSRPTYSPDGKWLLYCHLDDRTDPGAAGAHNWFIIPSDGGSRKSVGGDLAVIYASVWWPDSSALIFESRLVGESQRLWRQPLNSTQPLPLATSMDSFDDGRGIPCAVTPAGKLLFMPYALRNSRLYLLDLSHSTAGSLSSADFKALAQFDMPVSGCSVSNQGQVFAQLAKPSASRFLIQSGELRQISPEGSTEYFDSASANGRAEIYSSATESPISSVWRQPDGQSRQLDDIGNAVLSADGYSAWAGSQTRQKIVLLDLSHPDRMRTYNQPGLIWASSRDASFALMYLAPSAPRQIGLLEAASGRATPVLAHSQWNLYRATLSSDEKWVAFTAVHEDATVHMMIAPFRGPHAVPPSEWIEIGQGGSQKFSLDGDLLYFQSRRYGFSCLYQISLDPLTKHPIGEPKPLMHFHGDLSPSYLPPDTFRMQPATDGIHLSLGRSNDRIVRLR